MSSVTLSERASEPTGAEEIAWIHQVAEERDLSRAETLRQVVRFARRHMSPEDFTDVRYSPTNAPLDTEDHVEDSTPSGEKKQSGGKRLADLPPVEKEQEPRPGTDAPPEEHSDSDGGEKEPPKEKPDGFFDRVFRST